MVARRSMPFSMSHGVIVVVGLVTFVVVAMALADRRATVEVAVVDGDHAAGAPVRVRSMEMPVDETVPVDRWVLAEELPDGGVALATLRDGDPLLRSQVGTDRTEPRTAVIEIDAAVAEGLALEVGSTVDVVAMVDGERPTFVLRDVVVVRVPGGVADGLLAAGGDRWVAVAVDDRQALDLAAATDAGPLLVMRSGSARS